MQINNVKLAYLGEINGLDMTDKELIDLFCKAEPKKFKEGDGGFSDQLRRKGTYSKIVRPYGNIFYIFHTYSGKEVWRVVPIIHNDDVLEWNPAPRYGNLRKRAVVDFGCIKFNCTAYEGEEYRIKIQMMNCGKEMLARDIYGAGNEDVKREIEDMIKVCYSNLSFCMDKLSLDKSKY